MVTPAPSDVAPVGPTDGAPAASAATGARGPVAAGAAPAAGPGTPDATSTPDAAEAPAPYRRVRDLLVAAVVAALGVAVLVGAQDLPEPAASSGGMGPAWWPTLLGGFLLLAAVGIAVAGVVRVGTPDDPPATRDGVLQLGALAVLVVAYGAAWHYFHFVAVTLVFTSALTAVLGSRGWRELVLFPIVVVALLYGIFGMLLRVPL